MSDGGPDLPRRRKGEWIQQALLPEEEVTVELRLTFMRGMPMVHTSYTIVRPDHSWVACFVNGPVADGATLRRAVDRMLDEALEVVREVVPPF